MKTKRQIKTRALARRMRWIRDGRPRRMSKGLSSEILAYISAFPKELALQRIEAWVRSRPFA